MSLDPDQLDAALAAERAPFVLDVRDPAAFELGHLPNAHNVPVHEMARRPKDLPQSKIARVLVIADSKKRGVAAANWLVLMGFVDVALVPGGIESFRGALETGPARAKPPHKGPELRIVP